MMRLRVKPVVAAGGVEPFVVPDDILKGNTAAANDTTAAIDVAYATGISTDAVTGESFVYVADANGKRLVELRRLVFSKQLVSFTTLYSSGSQRMYGYGEHDYYYFINNVNNVTLSLWNTDNGTPWQKPMYGVHPTVFHSDPILQRHFATMWMNSHAQNVHIESHNVTFTAVGGIIDLYVFVDTTPLGVVRQYHQLIGPSAVPPYWALGVHQCRWGYTNLSDVEAVVAGYESANIPLEVVWNDIDYMEKFRVFTTDPTRYPEAALRTFVDKLHAKNMRYVQITDPGVAQADNYSVYTSGIESNAFIHTQDGSVLINAVWPGWTAFPDFTLPSAQAWWADQIATYRSTIPIDGMWLDMNELGTFCGGQCNVAVGTPWSVDWNTVDWNRFTIDICMPNNCTVVESPLNYPPVNPLQNGFQLFNKTLDMTGVLRLGSYYETKTFYGLMEAKSSHDALLAQTGTRPFLLTRASFVGSGRYSAHWTGDNNAQWERGTGGIYDSVQAVLGSNLWGIPMVGADIGGFSGITTEELLVRWYQLGAYYPFTRNHHGLDGPGQEPYRFSQAAQASIRTSLLNKYRLLPYYFTCLVDAHDGLGPVLRHMSLQFPDELQVYQESTQFMVGDAITVPPVVTQGENSTAMFLPLGEWYSLWSGNHMVTVEGDSGFWIIALDELYDGALVVGAYGGNIVPMHETPAMTVTATQASGVGLRAFMDSAGEASGHLVIASDVPLDQQVVTRMNFTASGSMASGVLTTMGNGETRANTTRLPTAVTVRVSFPTLPDCGNSATPYYAPANVSISIGSTDDMTVLPLVRNVTLNLTCSSISFMLPVGVDATTVFTARWIVGVPQTPSPTASSPSDSKTGAIVGGCIGGIAIVVFTVAIVMWRRRESEGEADYTPLS
eukprot:CAMPEP_0176406814 /NCGR_PEP_ID=MMETSP0127-20121128/1078_1 /TAXON_ID=938130 /ORGANISM="Platyophrya macrostoma, Strain WH" /LENGTH=894 /DNA_ID=CAMNT_0017785977 /DNA_START=246 /DNA_END=2930 /DNA_ORIENTATION=-